ncbi:MAG: ABC transporter permease [Vicinamibacterales bacterium]
MVGSVLEDVRRGVRHLVRSPVFSLATIATLALGLGANAAMVSAWNALMLRPLPVRSPSELVWARGFGSQGQTRLMLITAVPRLEEDPGPLTGHCAWNGNLVLPVEANGEPTQATIDFMSAGCLDTLGLVPVLGRAYTAAEAPLTTAGAPVVLIHHRFWQRMFGGDTAVVGKRLSTEGRQLEIIGVLPAGYDGIQVDGGADIVAPFGSILPGPVGRPPGASLIVARLRPGATLDQARAHLAPRWRAVVEAVLPPGLTARERDTFLDVHVRIESLARGLSDLRDQYRRPVQVALGLTGILLALVCANLGGLLLARMAAREQELRVRRALGATGGRLFRQMAIECLLLAGVGTAVGSVLASTLLGMIEGLLPAKLTGRTLSLTPDLRVIAVTTVGGLLTAVLICLVPIVSTLRRANAAEGQWHRTIAGAGARRHRLLLVTQVALCSILVVGAGLLSRSLAALRDADIGVRADHVLSVRLMPVPNGHERFDAASYYPALLERIAALPSVRRVGYARMFPHLTTSTPQLAPITVTGEPDPDIGAQFDVVSPRFFETVSIRLLRGRGIEAGDDARTGAVAVVNEKLARQLAAGGEVIGRRISYGTGPGRENIEVVGVVSDATLGSFRATSPPIVYLSALQAGRLGYYPTLAIATAGEPLQIAPEVERLVRSLGHEHRRYCTAARRVPRPERLDRATGDGRGRRDGAHRCCAGARRAVCAPRICRDAAHARDRRAPGARSDLGLGAPDGDARGPHRGALRHRRWRAARDLAGAAPGVAALRDCAARRDHPGRDGRCVSARRGAGRGRPRDTGVSGGPAVVLRTD